MNARCLFLVLAVVAAPALTGCPAPEPPKTAAKVEPAKTEDDAKRALAKAKEQDDPMALVEVFHQYGAFPSGKSALRLGVRKLLEKALDAGEKCDEPAAKGALARVAPYTTDDPEIDEAYDETRSAVSREHKRCILVKLDADVKKAEAEGDWPRAFDRISSEKDADGAALKKRRVELTGRWKAWVDGTISSILAKKSFEAVLGDKRDAFEAAIDPSRLPPEVSTELGKRSAYVQALSLVFETLEEGAIVDPPIRYWTYGEAKARKVDAPTATDGPVLENGIEFHAVAKGKIGGVTVLVAGPAEGSVLDRLAAAKAIIPEADSRRWDTNIVLPEQLVGVRVLAPVAPGSDLLTPSLVLAETNGLVVVEPLAKKGAKVTAKRKDLRGLAIGPGLKVTVMISGVAKPAELADVPEADRVLVRVAGFESYVPLGDVRIKRAELPAPPPEK